MNTDGTVSTKSAPGTFSNPTDIEVAASGAVYVAGYGDHRVSKIVGTTVTVVAGTGVAGFCVVSVSIAGRCQMEAFASIR